MRSICLVLTLLMPFLAEAKPLNCPKVFTKHSGIHDDNGDFIPGIAVSVALKVMRPTLTLKNFPEVSFLLDHSCKGAIVVQRVLDLGTGDVYSAYFSNDDTCDGGNSYGVVFRGMRPLTAQAVCLIQDSEYYSETTR